MRWRVLLAALVALPAVASAQSPSETVEYYGADAIGSIRIVFAPDGTVLGRQDYGPFGQPLFPAPQLSPERFGGNTTDDETQQAYFHARQFQARTGRFASVDPMFAGLFEPQGWNRYAYAMNRPLTFRDASGRAVTCLASNGSAYCDDGVTVIGHVPGGGGGGGIGNDDMLTMPGLDPGDTGGGTTGSDPGQGNPPADPTDDPTPNPPPNPPGPNPPVPNSPKRQSRSFLDLMRCAAAGGNRLSILNGLTLLSSQMPNNYWTQSLFGNDASTISSVLTGPSRLDALRQTVPANALAVGISYAGTVYEDVARIRYGRTSGAMEVGCGHKRFWRNRRSSIFNHFDAQIGLGRRYLPRLLGCVRDRTSMTTACSWFYAC